VIDIMDVNSIGVSASRARVLGSTTGTSGAIVTFSAVVSVVISHACVRAVELRRAQMQAVERVDALQRIVVTNGS